MAKKKTKRHGAAGQGAGAPVTNGAGSEVERDEPEGAGDEGENLAAEAADGEGERDSEAAAAPEKVVKDAAASDDEVMADVAAAARTESAYDPEAATRAAEKKPKGKPWGEPFARFEAAWTKLETRLITWVLVAQLLSMVAWVFLSGLSSPVQSGNLSGLVMRGLLGAVGLGAGGWYLSRKQTLNVRRGAAIGGLLLGALVAPLWRTTGVDYFDNVKAWLQEGSTLTLMGGLRGVATRLTLWLALLGASLATATGKHINIDVVFRFIPARFRLPIAIINYSAAALMCLGAVWGFFDHIAIESFGANADDTAGKKISITADRLGDHFFLARKQIGLDLRSFPHIVKGDRFDHWMSAPAWNEWVKDADFESHYTKEQVETTLVADDAPPHTPLVVSPDGESARGLLVLALGLVFPFGMLVLALRFLLRALLALSGHVEVDPDAAHKDELGTHTAVASLPGKEGV